MDDSNKLVQRQFGAHASNYVTSPVHAQGQSLARLVELTQPQADWIVLDVSTGAGHTALAFAPHVARVVAVDITLEMLQAAARLANERGVANVEFKPADALALPFEAATFDLVTNRMALHHFSDTRKGIAEMARVCKTGGLVALADNVVPPDKQTAGYINHFEKLRDPSHNWAFPLVRLEAYFADAGLKVEHSESFKKEIEFEPWADRMGNDEATKTKLKELLFNAPDEPRRFWEPRTVDDKLMFQLTEGIVVGRKA